MRTEDIFGNRYVGVFEYARRYRYGPAEWLWRSLTYRKRQPMRV